MRGRFEKATQVASVNGQQVEEYLTALLIKIVAAGEGRGILYWADRATAAWLQCPRSLPENYVEAMLLFLAWLRPRITSEEANRYYFEDMKAWRHHPELLALICRDDNLIPVLMEVAGNDFRHPALKWVSLAALVWAQVVRAMCAERPGKDIVDSLRVFEKQKQLPHEHLDWLQ